MLKAHKCECGGKSVVLDTRQSGALVRRRVKCGLCGAKWKTWEGRDKPAQVEVEAPVQVHRDGRTVTLRDALCRHEATFDLTAAAIAFERMAANAPSVAHAVASYCEASNASP